MASKRSELEVRVWGIRVLRRRDSAEMNLRDLVRMWRMMAWVSRDCELGFWRRIRL